MTAPAALSRQSSPARRVAWRAAFVGIVLGVVAGLAAAWALWVQPMNAWFEDNAGAVLIEHTHALRSLREGHVASWQAGTEQVVWMQIRIHAQTLAQEGRAPGGLLRPAIDYHCAHVEAGTPAPDAAAMAERRGWCATLQGTATRR